MRRELRLRPTRYPLTRAVQLTALGVLLWMPFHPAWGDDRALLRQSAENPYLFIILDTSGSMNEVPETATNAFAFSDDPASKLYQAKEALFEVMSEFDDIFYGFATFNQDELRAARKHWVYTADADPSWSGTLGYPVQGQGYVFGGGDDNSQFSCGSPMSIPATGNSLLSLVRYPRTGDRGDQTLETWLRRNGRNYLVETRLVSGVLGDPTLQVEIRRRRVGEFSSGSERCGNGDPGDLPADGGPTFDETIGWETVTYTLATDLLVRESPDDVLSKRSPQDNTCFGLDLNDDDSIDDFEIVIPGPNPVVNLKYPTTTNPAFSTNARFNRGDFLPFDWTRTHRDEVLSRLAPNLRLGESVPDFRVARYFEDLPTGLGSTSNHALALRNPDVRPLMAEGNTPLGASIEDFRTWFAGCPRGTCPKNSGWKDVAALPQNDPLWACRKKYLLVLTDGDETCGGGNSACTGTAALRAQEAITTFVVAFGVQGGGNVLTCMAANGGSGEPVFPQDKTALIAELRKIFGEIREQSRTFASAAVPGVQAAVQDKIYLTNFTPLNPPITPLIPTPPPLPTFNNAYWDGHVDAYLKPLPLTTDGFPDKSRTCAGGKTSECHVWDAGVKILDLAPTAAELSGSSPNFRVGGANTQRRTFYTQTQAPGAVPLPRKLLLPQSSDADRTDLYLGLGVPVPNFAVTAEVNAAEQQVRDILKFTYAKKQAEVEVAAGTVTITYLLGDIFHSNPTVLSSPSRALYFAADLETLGKNCFDGDPGYRCFAAKHELRRKMLVVGSNDQQLHIFDAGIFRGNVDTGKFDDGTGYEILSYVPRPLLPNLKTLAGSGAGQDWGVDGTVRLDDVFIDPSHNGTPTESEREWRSVMMAGLREGGSGYFALDLTQPDTLDSDDVPQPSSTWVPSCWNGGSGCGPVPFGAALWNFADTRDDDANGFPDLGDAWSVPNTGRILVRTTDTPPLQLVKYVAVFGGGMDPEKLNRRGNWLYMVDIETGKFIYKRRLDGSAPSDPAAVDTDQDGFLDTVYIGTTAGSLYKAKIGTAGTIERTAATNNEWLITDTAWEPFRVFDTLQSDTGRRGPIFFPPSVLFVTQLGKYALAFGTGNREHLWDKDQTPGRFYMILDDNFDSSITARNETQYTSLPTSGTVAGNTNFLLSPPAGAQAGWYLKLDPDERMITAPFALSGITIFTSYDPRTDVTQTGQGTNTTPVCAQAGESNIFTIYTTNGNPVDTSLNARFERRSDFVTNPFVELSVTKNQPNTGTGGTGGNTSPDLCADKSAVTDALKSMFSSSCQFTSYTQNIETIQSDSGLVCIAPVPICVVRKNWREN